NIQFDTLLAAFKTGKIDLIISGITTTPQTKKQLHFSHPYIQTPNLILITKNNNHTYHNFTHFNNKKIPPQKATEQEKIPQQEIQNPQISSLNPLPDPIFPLKTKK
ncbi:transporter substrate-binding domain-containing protein, partial [Staphylococcus haemolyticus]|uniref:transporter substrate-binding domain-containing protein n=1 Tax=Staphylococcus haemolyticus TaxID=1283 RepID=UPI0011A88AD7